MSFADLLRGPRSRITDETVAAIQAVKAIAESLGNDQPLPAEAVQTAVRVLAPTSAAPLATGDAWSLEPATPRQTSAH